MCAGSERFLGRAFCSALKAGREDWLRAEPGLVGSGVVPFDSMSWFGLTHHVHLLFKNTTVTE